MAEAICPCCGGPMPVAVPAAAIRAIPMPESEKTIVDLLVAAYPQNVRTDVIARHIWAHDPNGGPLQMTNGIGVRVFRLNKRLKPLGWRVMAGGNSWNGRRLERLEVTNGQS